jgi:hypothetical protein
MLATVHCIRARNLYTVWVRSHIFSTFYETDFLFVRVRLKNFYCVSKAEDVKKVAINSANFFLNICFPKNYTFHTLSEWIWHLSCGSLKKYFIVWGYFRYGTQDELCVKFKDIVMPSFNLLWDSMYIVVSPCARHGLHSSYLTCAGVRCA